jgi:AcrR family transcriptional regulator
MTSLQPSRSCLVNGGPLSKKCSFLRARRPEQKAQRRADLLRAVAELVEEQGVMGVSVGAITERVGLSKGNLYRYFDSREAILLELLYEGWADWVEAVERELAPSGVHGDAQAVARVLTATAAARPHTCELVAVRSSVLEQNLSAGVILDFKLRGQGLIIRMNNALHAALPSLGLEGARVFFNAFVALLAGLWPMANPSPAVARVLERPELQEFRYDFEPSLLRATEALLVGMMAQSEVTHS